MEAPNNNTDSSDSLKSDFTLTPSVKNAISNYKNDQKISSSKLAETLLHSHSDYADRKPSSITLNETKQKKTAIEWVEETKTLFDTNKIGSSGNHKDRLYDQHY